MQTEVRVRVYTLDRELRAWLVDELALISPTIEVQAIDAIDLLGSTVTAAQLLIVGVDALSVDEVERLRELVEHRGVPVIAIGAPSTRLAGAHFACVLDAKLTSKQLKRAVHDSLAEPSHVA